MKKQIFVNALVYFVCIFAAMLVNLFVAWLGIKIVDVFVAIDFFGIALTRVVACFITLGVVICAVGYYEGYKSAAVNFPLTALSFLIAYICYVPLAFVFRFYNFIAGGTRYFAGMFQYGTNLAEFKLVEEIPTIYNILALSVYIFTAFILFFIASVIGKNKRIANRKELLGE